MKRKRETTPEAAKLLAEAAADYKAYNSDETRAANAAKRREQMTSAQRQAESKVGE